MECSYCGSENIVEGVSWVQSMEGTREVGLRHQGRFFLGVSQVYSDLCLDCGTIVRSYVKELDKNYVNAIEFSDFGKAE